jgi:RNA polymerase sigma factor (sigma-70 family)
MVRKYTTTTEEGFNVRLEARLKNAELTGAKEMAGLTATEVAERIGISYGSYLAFESMRAYPGEETQRKICGFYRNLGVFLLEEDVFPKELKKLDLKRKYIGEKTIPKIELLSLSTSEFDRKLLPVIEGEIEKKVEDDELHAEINRILSKLSHRQEQMIRMRFGLDDEKPKTYWEIGKIFGVSRERIRQIEEKMLKRLKHPHYRGNLKSFLESYHEPRS